MKVKQVFLTDDFQENNSLHHFKYCPSCGAKCVVQEHGGKQRPACIKCGFIHYKNPSPAVSVLIMTNKKILLGRRAYGSFKAGKWCLPCGFIEFDEDFLTAARREVEEETGLIVEILSIISVMSNYLSADLHTLVIVLLAQVIGGELCPGDDIDEVEWFSLSGPLPEMAFEADKDIIARYFQTGINGVPVDIDFSQAKNEK